MTRRERVESFAVNSGWSEGEIIYLCSERAKGTPIIKIAEEMERTPRAIKEKVKRMGLTPRASCTMHRKPPQAARLSPKMPVLDNREGFAEALKTLRG